MRRTNFHPKYNEESQLLIIIKNNVNIKAKISSEEYEVFLNMMNFFSTPKKVDESINTYQQKKMLKFCIQNNLLVNDTQENYSISNFMYKLIENSFDDYKKVLNLATQTCFQSLKSPVGFDLFLEKHGFNSDSNNIQKIIWKNDSSKETNEVHIYWSKDEMIVTYSDNSIDDNNNMTNLYYLHVIKKYLKTLDNIKEKDIITQVSNTGMITNHSIYSVTSSEKYINVDKLYDNTKQNSIDYIQSLEKSYLKFPFLNIDLNFTSETYPNSLNVAQYSIRINKNFEYTCFDFKYKGAAEKCLTDVLGKYLNTIDLNKNDWIAAKSKKEFFIKGYSSYLKGTVSYQELTHLPNKIKNKINEIELYLDNRYNIKIVLNYIYKDFTFNLLLVDESNFVLYQSDIAVNLEAEIEIGLAHILAYDNNNILKKGRQLNIDKNLPYPNKQYTIDYIYNSVKNEKIIKEEHIYLWKFQKHFLNEGIHIGYFNF